MTWYFWNPETDELRPMKYKFQSSPMHLWEAELVDHVKHMEKVRRVAETHVKAAWISTIFLGLDHAWNGGTPVLFETMIFDLSFKRRRYDDFQVRYTSSAEARENHERVSRLCKWLLLKAPQVSYRNFGEILGKL